MMELRHLTKTYDGKPAVVDLSLDVNDNEYLTLLGPSGSGKSTLLRIVAGLERPDSGEVILDGEPLTGKPTYLRGLGFVQQNYALFPHMSVQDNVAFGLRNRLENRITDEAEVRRRTLAMLELVGLGDLGDRMVGQTSGGQKQRVSLARTLVTEPQICLLDEPLGALDANLRERMTVELRRIRTALGVTFVHVTANETEAVAMGDRMVVLDEGRVIQVDDPDTVYNRPATVHAAKYVNAYNILPGAYRDGVFDHAGQKLALPAGMEAAAYYVVRFDLTTVAAADEKIGKDQASMDARFIASEFMGSAVTYFFQRDDGEVLEVVRHLSSGDPEIYQTGETRRIVWNVGEVLLFDAGGKRIEPSPTEKAA